MQFRSGYKPIWDTWTVNRRWKFIWRLERIFRKRAAEKPLTDSAIKEAAMFIEQQKL